LFLKKGNVKEHSVVDTSQGLYVKQLDEKNSNKPQFLVINAQGTYSVFGTSPISELVLDGAKGVEGPFVVTANVFGNIENKAVSTLNLVLTGEPASNHVPVRNNGFSLIQIVGFGLAICLVISLIVCYQSTKKSKGLSSH
jgi:hypothetical protein